LGHPVQDYMTLYTRVYNTYDTTQHYTDNTIQGESKKTDTFDIQMNNKGVSFFLLTLYNVIQDYVTTYKGYTTLYDTI
jgi:hypothetical protein